MKQKEKPAVSITAIFPMVVSFIVVFLSLEAFSQELPCRRKYEPSKGSGCMERYNEDGDGEKHGKYIGYAEDGTVVERGNYVHGIKQGNWFETASNGNDWARSVVLGYAHTPNSWYEKGEYIISATDPITSYAQALKLKQDFEKQQKEEAIKKEAEQRRNEAKLKAYQDSVQSARAKQEKDQAARERLGNIEWAFSNDACWFLEIASSDDARRNEAISKCDQRKLENKVFMDADNTLAYETFRPYDGEQAAYNSQVILLQGSLSYFGVINQSEINNDRDNIQRIEMKIEGLNKYIQQFPQGYRVSVAKERLQAFGKAEDRWMDDVGRQYYTCIAEIVDNTILGTTEGYQAALQWWTLLNKIDRNSNDHGFSRWKVQLLSGYIIMCKWALHDIDGATAMYKSYRNLNVPTHGGLNNYFQHVGLPPTAGDAVKYPKYFKLVYEKVSKKIVLPDAKVNYKVITAE